MNIKHGNLLNIKFDSEPVYGDNYKYIKIKIKIYGDIWRYILHVNVYH